jgi:hypothetical protein
MRRYNLLTDCPSVSSYNKQLLVGILISMCLWTVRRHNSIYASNSPSIYIYQSILHWPKHTLKLSTSPHPYPYSFPLLPHPPAPRRRRPPPSSSRPAAAPLRACASPPPPISSRPTAAPLRTCTSPLPPSSSATPPLASKQQQVRRRLWLPDSSPPPSLESSGRPLLRPSLPQIQQQVAPPHLGPSHPACTIVPNSLSNRWRHKAHPCSLPQIRRCLLPLPTTTGDGLASSQCG